MRNLFYKFRNFFEGALLSLVFVYIWHLLDSFKYLDKMYAFYSYYEKYLKVIIILSKLDTTAAFFPEIMVGF